MAKKEMSRFKAEVKYACERLGRSMQYWRLDRNMTQKGIAQKMETDQARISNYENNNTAIPASAVIEYSKVLHVSVSDLFGENDIVEISDDNILAEYHKLSNRLQYYVYSMLREMNKI